MSDTDFEQLIDRLYELFHANRDGEVLEAIEQMDEGRRNHTQIVRLKSMAHGFGRGGDINEAYAGLRELATRSDNTIEDLYWAGQRAAEFCDYKDAEVFLGAAIDRSKQEDDCYYLNCALLLRAYVRIHLRKFSLAQKDIDQIDDDECEICWSPELGHISRKDLIAYLGSNDLSSARSTAPCSCQKKTKGDQQ